MSLSLTILLFYLVTKAVILTIWCHLYCQTTKKCCTFHYFYILIIVECVQRIKCKPFCRLQYTFQVINILQSLTSENDSRYEASITLLVPVQIKSKSFKSWTKYQISIKNRYYSNPSYTDIILEIYFRRWRLWKSRKRSAKVMIKLFMSVTKKVDYILQTRTVREFIAWMRNWRKTA